MERVFEEIAPHIMRADVVADIGPGIRPQPFYKPTQHICIEPHGEYADVLEGLGYQVVRKTALDALPDMPRVGVIFMLDVIEHMEKDEGILCVQFARARADQVVVFTPLGFREQSYRDGDKDAWGMNGTYWQTHRSGWTPEDFNGWKILHGQTSIPVFTAIWNR